jgi:molecular chaperone DnaK
LEKINEAWKVASEEMYKAQAEAQQAPGADSGQNGEPSNQEESSDVEDVDFEEVK